MEIHVQQQSHFKPGKTPRLAGLITLLLFAMLSFATACGGGASNSSASTSSTGSNSSDAGSSANSSSAGSTNGKYVEKLDRGVVAINMTDGVFVS